MTALAMFIPLIMGTAGNAGSQTATLTVRGLATSEIGTGRFLMFVMQEIGTGALLGLGLGTGACFLAFFLTSNFSLGIAVGSAIFFTVVCANIVGMSLPFGFRLFRVDPAVASAPLITTIGDAIGLLLYFNIAQVFLRLI
ncbi:MAG: magnesium transporter [Bacillota bacterium]